MMIQHIARLPKPEEKYGLHLQLEGYIKILKDIGFD